MPVLLSLMLMAIFAPLALIYLRARSASVWWCSFLSVTVVLVVVIWFQASALETKELLGVLLLFIVPLTLLFLVARSEFFAKRRMLIGVLGPLVFIAGFFLALSFVVGLGLLQP